MSNEQLEHEAGEEVIPEPVEPTGDEDKEIEP